MGLLWEWWVASTQALVDEVGPEEALRALRPYYLNANDAAIAIVSNHFVELAKDPDFSAKMTIFATEAWYGGETSLRISEGLMVMDHHGCMTRGESKELCHMVCKELMDNQAQLLDKEAFAVLEMSLCQGDDHCRVVIGTREGMTGRSSGSMRGIDRPEISDWEFQSFQRQYVSESWVLTTRALINRLGPERAGETLRAYMRHSGLAHGLEIAERLGPRPWDAPMLAHLVALFNRNHLKNDRGPGSPEPAGAEIDGCPFSQAPLEICLQYQAFFDGVMEALNPEYELAFEARVTDGDKACRWMIRRKGISERHGHQSETPPQESIKRLTDMFIDGRITEEEFRWRLAILKELRV